MSEETPQDRRPLPPTDMSRTNVPIDGPSKKVSNGQGMDDRTRVLLATAIAVVALFAISAFAVFAMGSFTNVMPIRARVPRAPRAIPALRVTEEGMATTALREIVARPVRTAQLATLEGGPASDLRQIFQFRP